MYVIDVNTCFGRRIEWDYDLSLESLLQDLESHRVAAALTYSLRGVHYEAPAGNRETLAAAQANSGLLPVGTLDLREHVGWEAELDFCLTQGCRALRFFPEVQSWSVSSLLFPRVLERLRGTGIPLLCSTGAGLLGGAGYAAELAHLTAGSGHPLIFLDTNYGSMAEMIEIVRTYPHVYIETNWLASMGAVEMMAEMVGVERLMFGSDAGMRPMQKALNEVLEAGLSAADKEAILGGNARRVLGISAADLAGRPQLEDLEPRSFGEELIDVHSHLGYWRCPAVQEGYDPSAMVARMRRYGIRRSILSAYESMRYDMEAGNRSVAQAIEGYPELLGYVELNPHDLAGCCAEMDRYYPTGKFAGVELELLHTVQPTDSPEVHALMAEIAKRGKPILLEPQLAGDAAAERQLGRENPGLTIIHAHGIDAAWARVIADTPNICVEFNRSAPCHHDIRDCLKILGPERLLFGTDQTLLSVGASVGLYMDAGLAPAERRLVLSENARRLFRL